ncbi:peroxisome assembly protein (Peroxin-2) [Entomophthora muscae]|uniref:Peroxisome assembly protein (Peroxin-2) n=1 Tax=Entomophthora muscae TaxID=34485 RepID=A0ACC2S3U1_9FUNG|nr:peroxisome assembly protein (Peroxin-2) [Entomophthora muscae]
MVVGGGGSQGTSNPITKLIDKSKFWLQSSEPGVELGSVVEYKNEESPISLKVSRVSQLDAELLDRELCDILKSKLFLGLSYFKTDIKANFEPELNALLQLVLYRFSIWSPSYASYGSQLQNLRFRDESGGDLYTSRTNNPRQRQLLLYGLFMIGGQYLWARWHRWGVGGGWGNISYQDDWRGKVYTWVTRLEKYSKLLTLLNYIVFLCNGRYRGITERVLGLRLVNGSSNGPRQLNYEFLNRQLVWDGLTEFLLFVAPLINLERMGKYVRQLGTRLAGGNNLDGDYSEEHQKVLAELPTTTCAFCYYHCHLSPESSPDPYSTDPASETGNDPRFMGSSDCRAQIPHVADCGHVFCYLCLETAILTDTGSTSCPRCGLAIHSSTRYLEKASS